MSARLMVISGPNRGATYFLQEGENILGRMPECQVVLASTQVSKRHCAVVCKGNRAELSDLGSSNGTFVNGVLAKKRNLQNHDRVSVGPFVLEVLLPELPAMQQSGMGLPQVGDGGMVPPISIEPGQFKMEEEPKGLVAKYRRKFDNIFLPVVYDFYERYDYVTILAVMFGAYALLSLGFSVYPVLQSSREEVLRQAEHQSIYIATQVADLNRQALLEGREGSLATAFAESEIYVQEVVIANLEGRILAPGARLNETFNNPYFLKYKDRLQKYQNLWDRPFIQRIPDKDLIITFRPILVLSKTKGINVPAAVSVVIYSTASVALDSGTIGTVYLEALFWSSALGVVFLYLVYSMTYRPIYHLMDDVDRVLKGEANAVEKKYKSEIIDQLIDSVNAVLSRIPRDTGKSEAELDAADQERVIVNNMMRSIEYLASKAAHGMMLIDTEMRIQLTNEAFDELTGIRGAQGELLDTVSRDESLPSLVREMMEKAVEAGNDGVEEDYDFSSGLHRIHAVALSGMPGRTEAYVFLFEKQGD